MNSTEIYEYLDEALNLVFYMPLAAKVLYFVLVTSPLIRNSCRVYRHWDQIYARLVDSKGPMALVTARGMLISWLGVFTVAAVAVQMLFGEKVAPDGTPYEYKYFSNPRTMKAG